MKRTLLLLAKIGVTLLLLWLVGRRLDVQALQDRLAAMHPAPLLLALLLVAGQTLLLVGWRWQCVLRVLGTALPLPRLVGLMMLGHFINQALPATVGGDAMRIWLLSRDRPGTGVAFRSVVIERLIGMVGLLLLALPGVPYVLVLTGGDLRGLSASAFVVGLLAFIVLPGPLLGRYRWFRAEIARRKLDGLATAMGTVLRDRRTFLILLASSTAGHAANCLAIWLIAHAYGIPFGLWAALGLLPTVFVLLIVPISFGGWGLREGAMVLALGLVGIEVADALLLSVTFGLVGMTTALPGLAVWLFGRLPLRRPSTADAA